jgi:hypothetical protein
MEIGFFFLALFALLVGVFIFRFDYPSNRARKITGRGGDFNE